MVFGTQQCLLEACFCLYAERTRKNMLEGFPRVALNKVFGHHSTEDNSSFNSIPLVISAHRLMLL